VYCCIILCIVVSYCVLLYLGNRALVGKLKERDRLENIGIVRVGYSRGSDRNRMEDFGVDLRGSG
jgi:hypothetical protein